MVKIVIIVAIGKMTNFGSDKYSSIHSVINIPPPTVLEYLVKMYKHLQIYTLESLFFRGFLTARLDNNIKRT